MANSISPRRRVCAAIITTLTAALSLAGGADAQAASTSCPQATASVSSVPAAAISEAVRCLINAERGGRNLAPLRRSHALRVAATGHSRDMVARRFFAHVSIGGATLTDRARRAGYRGRTLGEDIGWGTYELGTPAAIVRAWMHSPPHRAVILNGRYREIGVGVTVGTPTGRTSAGAVYVLDVGRR